MKTAIRLGTLSAALACILATANVANAAVITSLVGDKDGFGVASLPAVPANGTVIFNAGQVTELADPIAHDQWANNIEDGSSLSYTHSYALGGFSALSALLTIQTAGMSDGRGPWDVFWNSTKVGQILNNGSSGTTSLISSFAISTALLTGSDTLRLDYLTPSVGEGFSINFSELVITTTDEISVPEPTTLGLMGLGLIGLGFARRRKTLA
jgi:hypothetical protein